MSIKSPRHQWVKGCMHYHVTGKLEHVIITTALSCNKYSFFHHISMIMHEFAWHCLQQFYHHRLLIKLQLMLRFRFVGIVWGKYHGWPSTQPGSLHTALQRKYTQPCSLFSRARLCEQWGHGCVNNGAQLCASARLCRGSPVSIFKRTSQDIKIIGNQVCL